MQQSGHSVEHFLNNRNNNNNRKTIEIQLVRPTEVCGKV